MKVRGKLLAALAAPALVGAVFWQAAGPAAAAPRVTAQQPAAAADDDDPALNAPGNGLSSCRGGAQEQALVQMNDLPTNLVENGAFALLPGAVVNFNTPANDTDQILVTFSGEGRLTGQPLSYVPPVDFLQIRVLLDGVPMPPLNDLAFSTDAGNADAAEACVRIPTADVAMVHQVRVEWQLVDTGANNVLTGTLDDWVLHVEINN